ncbi:MAG TPA: Gfo/Idh/MocA family oxidoreductase [Candidatus Saccharimonadia bacterium]|nr:Gfo/Idh/MocA family oxidoreductase [Candidatus Saccharimonadia bacterium]
MPSMQKVRTAVIGGGNMGKNHLRNYFLLPETDLLGLADINPDTKKLADEYKAKFYTDYKQMLDELQPEAVSVVVPTPFHIEVATEVMNRGIHCLLEKPIASTVKEADTLINLAAKKGVVFTVGHIEHYNPVVRKLKKMVDAGKLGTITSIVAKRVGGFPAVEPKTDVIIDLAVHDIGIISFILGQQPKVIHSHGSRTHHSREVDAAEILMDYGHASGFVQANWLTPVKIRTIAITGSAGYVEGNYITQELEYYEHNMHQVADGFSNFVAGVGEPERSIIKVDFEEPLALELKSFAAAIRGEKDVPLVSAQEAREALYLALESVKAYKG